MGSRDNATTPEPKHGDPVAIDGRRAVFLYRRGRAAVVRFEKTGGSRVVPFSKLRRCA